MRLGFDPEFFLKDQAGNFISSIGLIGGTKDRPESIGEGCYVQEDNVAVEFNTPPCSNADEVIKHFEYAMNVVKDVIQDKGLSIAIVPSAEFGADQLEDPRVRQAGCEVDYNAWTGKTNKRISLAKTSLRSAGGHIHVETTLDKREVIKWMDLFVGAWLIQFDKDTKRRSLYGKAGAYRPKPYGVEYRTPSCFWISSHEMIRNTWRQVEKAVSTAQEYADNKEKFPEDIAEMVQDCINNSDMSLFAFLDAYWGINE